MKETINISDIEALSDKKLVMIEWLKIDAPKSVKTSSEWAKLSEDEEEEDIEDENIPHCFSTGYILKDSAYCIRIAPHVVGGDDGDLSHIGSMLIPKGLIVDTKVLNIQIEDSVENEEGVEDEEDED